MSTDRRRGSNILRRLSALPASRWEHAVIDFPKRRHQRIRYVDERITLRDYKGDNGCYRWLASQFHGFDRSERKALHRKFVETSGAVEIASGRRIVVYFDRRSHNPILREAEQQEALDCPCIGLEPSSGQQSTRITFPKSLLEQSLRDDNVIKVL